MGCLESRFRIQRADITIALIVGIDDKDIGLGCIRSLLQQVKNAEHAMAAKYFKIFISSIFNGSLTI